MIRKERTSFAPLAFLLLFEIGAILALQALGNSPDMRVGWTNFGTWVNQPLDTVVPPLVRITALAVAYWMFLSTSMFLVAQISRIPAAIRATSVFTLPSVRRVVDGAMAVSIAGTSVLGVGSAAMAATPASAATPIVSTQDSHTIAYGSPVQIATPSLLGAVNTITNTADGSVPTPTVAAQTTSTTAVTTSTTAAPTTTSTTAAPTTSTTAAPTTTTAAPTTTTAAPSTNWTVPANDTGSVATPKPLSRAAETPASTTTTSSAPAAPAPPAPAAPGTTYGNNSAASGVLGVQEHRVSKGENLWTIARDALVQTGTTAPTEAQIRDYWLKVIDANRDSLRSKDPHWIFAGEVITLPQQTVTAR